MSFISDLGDSVGGGLIGSAFGGVAGSIGGLLGGGLGGNDVESAGSVQNMADPYHHLRKKYMGELASYTDAGPSASLTAGTNAVLKALGNANSGFKFKKSDPSYEWRKAQGEEAVARQMGAAGHNDSGNLYMELMNYGQNMASQEYSNEYDRWLKRNTLLSQLGTTATDLDQRKLQNLMTLSDVGRSSAAAGVEARQNENQFNMGVLGTIGKTVGSLFGL